MGSCSRRTGPSARFNLISNVTRGKLYFAAAVKVTSLGALSTGGSWVAGFNNSRGTQSTTPTNLATRILTRATGTGGFNIGTAKQTTDSADFVWSTTVFNTNETIFLVGSYQFNSGSSSDDVSSLWINPNPATFGSSTPPAPELTTSAGPDIGTVSTPQIASFVFLQRGLNNTNQPAAVIADELRIGPNWASVTPPGPPTLSAARSGTDLILSWPASGSGFVLESTPAFSPTSLWSEVSTPVYLIGDQFMVTNNAPTRTAFYRLRK